jgi:MFS family permease
VTSSGNLRAVLGSGPFRRLLGVRLISQFGDGLFQSALAGSLLFSPEKAPDGLRVATAFAVLLLPYSIVGPFVGVFLDRWSRRNVIYAANLVRAVLVVPMTLLTWYGQEGVLVYALGALLIIGINRFVLAGLSASQPHVVPADRLVTANALATTLGTVHYTLGLGVAGLTLSTILGKTHHGYAVLAASGALGYLGSALLAYFSFTRPALGPDDLPTDRLRHAVAAVAKGMVAGLRHLAGRPVAAYPLIAQGAFRILYGILALATLLLYRRYFYPGDRNAALAGLTQVIAAGGLGSLLAAFLTPPATRRFGGWRWITGLLAAIGVLVFALGLPFVPVLLVVATFFLSIGAQGIKIVVDTTIQQECHDDFRGRVFSVNDTTYNMCFVIGLFGAALALPDNGRSVLAILFVSAGYLAVAGWFGMAAARVAGQLAARSAALAGTARGGRRLD